VNGSVGYAINLIAFAVGRSRPPGIDRSTLASPSDYVCWVFGENEKWFAERMESPARGEGFSHFRQRRDGDGRLPPVENMDHWSQSAQEHIRWWEASQVRCRTWEGLAFRRS